MPQKFLGGTRVLTNQTWSAKPEQRFRNKTNRTLVPSRKGYDTNASVGYMMLQWNDCNHVTGQTFRVRNCTDQISYVADTLDWYSLLTLSSFPGVLGHYVTLYNTHVC